jgi:hypothetical protein
VFATQFRLANLHTADLLLYARQAREDAVRLRARSAELVARALTAMRASALNAETFAGRRTRLRSAATSRARARQIAAFVSLPLTPPMLLELADEFRLLAARADTPESRAAFDGLAFRYVALAGGFDTRAMSSHRLH